MKHLLLSILAFVSLTTFAAAQAVDPALQAAVDEAVPAQYAGYTSLVIISFMMLGRWIKALQNGTGIRGWISAIWMGTNTPKLLIACLCLLSLPSCQSTATNNRLGDLADLAITYSERRGVITAADAAAIRAAQVIILPPVDDSTTILEGIDPKHPVRVQP